MDFLNKCALAQLFEALRYKRQGRGFVFLSGHWAALWPWGRLIL
jgi:hypothetical protein